MARDCWIVVCAIAQNHSISSMFHRTLLDSLLSPHFSTSFPALARGSSTSLAGKSVDESIHCHSASTVMLWPMRWTIPSHKFGARRVNWGASSFSQQKSTHLENDPWVPDGRTRRNFNIPSSLIISSAVVVASTFSCSTW